VRLYGVDAPERGQPLWEEALTHARTIMGDRKLETLCGDHSYGRRVCRVLVEVDGQTLDLGLELVRSGLAYPAMRGGDPLYRDALDAAAKEAEAAGVGVWALPDGGVRPWEYRRR
jgi:endonuclease YncB( thermonuclease family)